jgi:hypothetical protein
VLYFYRTVWIKQQENCIAAGSQQTLLQESSPVDEESKTLSKNQADKENLC